MKDLKWVNDLKIRGDYGVTGNQDFGSYISLNTMTGFGYYFYNGKYFQVWGPSKNVNPDLKWEKGKNWNIGLDFSLFNNRLSFTADMYQRKTTKMLTQGQVLPGVLGTSVPQENAADLKTTGWDLTLSCFFGFPCVDSLSEWAFYFRITI